MTADHLSTTFAALADPTRRAILARLTAGEASVTELAEPFDDEACRPSRSTSRCSSARGWWRAGAKRSGARAGSTRRRSRTSRRGSRPYRAMWEQRLDRLDDYLRQLHREEKKHGRQKRRK